MLALGIKGIEYTVLRMGYVFWAFYTPMYTFTGHLQHYQALESNTHN